MPLLSSRKTNVHHPHQQSSNFRNSDTWFFASDFKPVPRIFLHRQQQHHQLDNKLNQHIKQQQKQNQLRNKHNNIHLVPSLNGWTINLNQSINEKDISFYPRQSLWHHKYFPTIHVVSVTH